MFYNFKKLLCLSMSVSIFSLIAAQSSFAQNVTLEPDNAMQLPNNAENNFLGVDSNIPDTLSLPDELPAPAGIQADEASSLPLLDGSSSAPQDATVPLDLDTPQPVAPALPLSGPNAPLGDGADISLPAANTQNSLPLTGPNAQNNLPLTGSNAQNNMPLTGPNAGLGLTPPAELGTTDQSNAPANNNFADVENLGEGLLDQIDNTLFSQMSDLEKQTALLTLELRREKIKSEIAAIKAQHLKAIEEEENRKQEQERKRIEWEKEQEAKVLREEKALTEAKAELERLRQEKVLKAYREAMLREKQAWIKSNAKLYAQIKNVENDRKSLVEGLNNKMAHISALANKAQKDAATAKDNYQREVKNLNTQISILKSRLEASLAEKKAAKENPFAQAQNRAPEPAPVEEVAKLVEEYAVMEIRGQGDELVAKLINKDGDSFMVRKGTVLQSGHKIDEITQTYIRAEINGAKDYLYFAAGGILEKEPAKSDIQGKKKVTTPRTNPNANLRNTTMVNKGVPSLGGSMFVR